jgi:ribosomal protein L11 methyltransferase
MRAFVVTVPEREQELAADVLWRFGVTAIEERHLADGRATDLWTTFGDDEPASIAASDAVTAHGWTVRLVELDADALASTWRQYVAPIPVDAALTIVPAWIDAGPQAADVTTVTIDPGVAFGLGDHPTTRLTLRAMRALWPSLDPAPRVLDVGCGSGVLSVVAALMGAREVVAVDVYPPALSITTDNAIRNGVAGRIVVGDADLGSFEERFDLIVANILAPVLVEIAPNLRRLVTAHGRLVVSGVLDGRGDDVVAALRPLTVTDRATEDGWAAIVLG